MKILLVEDNETLAKGLVYSLEQNKYNVIHTLNIKDTINYLIDEKPDLIILDISLPDGNGFDLYNREISKRKIATIFLTAKDDEDDIVKGLELGADDYITKPFSLIVLISKVNAFMRRIGNTIIENIIFCDKLKFDYVENKLTKDKEEILLSKNEGKLLKYLMENSSQTVTKEKLMEALWDIDGNFVDENTVAVNIRRLRQKVEDNPSEPEYIKNIRGVGYTFAKRCIKK